MYTFSISGVLASVRLLTELWGVWHSLGCLLDSCESFIGAPKAPKVASRSWPRRGQILAVFGRCRRAFQRSSGARITIEICAVHFRREIGAFILPRKTHNCSTCWVTPCAKIPAVSALWEVFRAAASPHPICTKGRGQILVVFRRMVTGNDMYCAGPGRLAVEKRSDF